MIYIIFLVFVLTITWYGGMINAGKQNKKLERGSKWEGGTLKSSV